MCVCVSTSTRARARTSILDLNKRGRVDGELLTYGEGGRGRCEGGNGLTAIFVRKYHPRRPGPIAAVLRMAG